MRPLEEENLCVRNTPHFSALWLSILRTVSCALACFFFCVLAYTCWVHGSPFRSELLIPWMVTTLIDYYLTLLPVCVPPLKLPPKNFLHTSNSPSSPHSLLLVAYRHRSSPIVAACVCLYMCCLGSFAVWSYICLVFCLLRPGDAVSRLLGPGVN